VAVATATPTLAPHVDVAVEHGQRPAQFGDDPSRDLLGVGRARALQQDGELVPPEAGDGVAGAYAPQKATPHSLEEHVSGGVAHGVVQGLEVVEVEEQHGEGVAPP
jgi:hypothetical protein